MYAIIGVGTTLTGHFMPGFDLNSLEIACYLWKSNRTPFL
jgi:hypothetical protein